MGRGISEKTKKLTLGAVLAAICDIKESRRQWAKEQFGEDFPVFEDYHDLFIRYIINLFDI